MDGMYLLGYDIGSSSVKAALVQIETGQTVGVVQYPATEMPIVAVQPGWAEQDPRQWWEYVCLATRQLLTQTGADATAIQGIGIAYQMHGLVALDTSGNPVRPSIIWCDSRAVEIGNQAFESIGASQCLLHLLNSPGNFTASKLKWVKDHEPALFARITQIMLPGDYIAFCLTGEALTTPSGLSEGMMWDFQTNDVADFLLEHYGFSRNLLPPVQPSCSLQGVVTPEAAAATGLVSGIPVTYRAGDQPNNALSLQVLDPGEIAATGGTSGVVYGVVDSPVYDVRSRVNSFAHVNHTAADPRIGVLLCINGAGIQYSWVRQQMGAAGLRYADMEKIAAQIPIGSEGLRILPFGNGSERILENRNPGATIRNLHFNRHEQAHFYRAALEGIAFSFVHGVGILQEMGLQTQLIRVGNDNLFQSAIFSETIASLLDCRIEMVETTGAVGAAKAAGLAVGIYSSLRQALSDAQIIHTYLPRQADLRYADAYSAWSTDLDALNHF